jgi:hypothetical protein
LVNQLRDAGAQFQLELPCMVVCGNQSAGESVQSPGRGLHRCCKQGASSVDPICICEQTHNHLACRQVIIAGAAVWGEAATRCRNLHQMPNRGEQQPDLWRSSSSNSNSSGRHKAVAAVNEPGACCSTASSCSSCLLHVRQSAAACSAVTVTSTALMRHAPVLMLLLLLSYKPQCYAAAVT